MFCVSSFFRHHIGIFHIDLLLLTTTFLFKKKSQYGGDERMKTQILTAQYHCTERLNICHSCWYYDKYSAWNILFICAKMIYYMRFWLVRNDKRNAECHWADSNSVWLKDDSLFHEKYRNDYYYYCQFCS